MLEPLAEDELHVWHGIAHERTVYADWALLSSAEHQRWWRLPPVAAARFAASHAARRRIAARYLDMPPALVEFGSTGTLGCDRTQPLSLSLSQSGNHWLLAVGRHPVGAAIRDLDQVVAEDALPEDALSEDALPEDALPEDALPEDALPEDAQPELFFRCWTRKEAPVKAAGIHGHDLRGVDVVPEREDRDQLAWPDSRTRWLVQSLPAAGGACVAVAVPADETGAVVMRSWPDRIQCQAA